MRMRILTRSDAPATESHRVRLLADENTSHRLVAACGRLIPRFPIVHIASWERGAWLGFHDALLLKSCAEHELILVTFDRATLPWHAGQVVREGDDHGGLVLFRRSVRVADYGHQARLLTGFWSQDSSTWDWANRIVYLPEDSMTDGAFAVRSYG